MEQTLFSTDLIPQRVASTLPNGYTLRPLQSGDYDRGVLDVLAVLTSVGEISKAKFLGIRNSLFLCLLENALNGCEDETIHISPLSLKMKQVES